MRNATANKVIRMLALNFVIITLLPPYYFRGAYTHRLYALRPWPVRSMILDCSVRRTKRRRTSPTMHSGEKGRTRSKPLDLISYQQLQVNPFTAMLFKFVAVS